jgi:phosphotransferase system HPr (HPr) family protein
MSAETPTKVSRQVEITNALGLHMRPAGKFAQLANTFAADIRVRLQGRESNGKSIMDLTMLVADRGTQIELEACGPDAEAALEALVELASYQFFEGPDGEELAWALPLDRSGGHMGNGAGS